MVLQVEMQCVLPGQNIHLIDGRSQQTKRQEEFMKEARASIFLFCGK
jgi:hypothetical protein